MPAKPADTNTAMNPRSTQFAPFTLPTLPDMPEGACDCHVHVIGPSADYAMVPERHYTPGPASADDLQRHLNRLQFQRSVIIQPSIYGTDNRCTLDAVQALNAQHPNTARAVVVLPPDVTPATLATLHDQGARGVRLNVESAAGRDSLALREQLEHWAPLLAPLGWHCQVFAATALIAAAAPTIRALPVPVVLDHFALIDPQTQPRTPATEVILQLLREGHVYIKLSAPYRLSRPVHGTPTQSAHAADQLRATPLAKTLLATRPDRLLWASDWPHTQREVGLTAHEVSAYRNIEASSLSQGIAAWLNTPETRQQVLVDNPARLYGLT